MNVNKAFDETSAVLSGSATAEDKTTAIKAVIDKCRTLTFKTIRELLGYHFVVPSYQRGYKWKSQQVHDLLNDIHEFSESNRSADHDRQFYCLQPIIVKKEGDKWHLIDGQQRLTTIYLILTYLEEKPSSFKLKYNTRTESRVFLDELNEKSFTEIPDNGKNIDIHHFQEAMRAIKEWFEEKETRSWKNVFLDKTQVIWYSPDATNQHSGDTRSAEIAVFSRINSGKIPLTNSELIRALFIHYSKNFNSEEVALLQQNKIASEWDYIEQQLHDEDFWCFVTLGNPFPKKGYANRIEFLLDLIESQKEKSKMDDTYSTFRRYSNWINHEKKEVVKLWQELKDLYYRFHEWYVDRDLYHLAGFARLAKINISVTDLLEMADKQTQSELIRSIKEKIRKAFFSESVEEALNETDYGNGDAVRKILLLFNVALAVANKHSAFFNFRSYLGTSWDIEHIRSRTPEGDKKKLLKDILVYWNYQADDESDSLKNRALRACSAKETIPDDLIQEVAKSFEDPNEKNNENFVHDIGNLCLLDSKTNRGYGNSPFPVKRKIILDRISVGQFVPPGTQNIFLKIYSSNISNMMFWQQKDADEYKEKIIDAIESLLGGN